MKLKGYTIVLAGILAGAVALGVAFAGSLTLFTGPTGTNPANNAADQADMNAIVNAINSAISPSGIFTGGATFQSASVTFSPAKSLTTGTLGPYQAGNVTAKGFITFVDSQGIQSFIPYWQ